MKRDRFYNVIFPVWMLLWVWPPMWGVSLVLNLLIDYGVVRLSLRHYGVEDAPGVARRVIMGVWLAGFAADFAGALLMVAAQLGGGEWWNRHILTAVMYNPFSSLAGLAWVLVSVGVSAALIYAVNLRLTLRRGGLDDVTRRRVARVLALCTAPYLFLLPTAWFF